MSGIIENEQLLQAQLTAHLAEHARLAGETHAVFQRQQQVINIIIILGTAAAGIIVQNQREILHGDRYVWLTLIPIPFLVLTVLHLRDDLKVKAIDEYIWLVLRQRVKKITCLKDQDLWNFLQVAHRINFGPPMKLGWFYLLFSMIRYALPFLIITGSLTLYISSDVGSRLTWSNWWSSANGRVLA